MRLGYVHPDLDFAPPTDASKDHPSTATSIPGRKPLLVNKQILPAIVAIHGVLINSATVGVFACGDVQVLSTKLKYRYKSPAW